MLVRLTGDDRAAVLALASRIDPADLAEKGAEPDPHVTVRYGLAPDSPAAVRDAVGGLTPFPFRLGAELGAFLDADTGAGHDVLFVPVEGAAGLRATHDRLGSLPHRDAHAGYHPHATVAYLKPGAAAKYVGMPGPGPVVTAGGVVYSDGDGAETPLFLSAREFSDAPAPAEEKPASGEIALAGADGRELARLIRSAKAGGVKVLADLTRAAVERRLAGERGALFTPAERDRLARAVAAANGTADLLGRVRVREQAERAAARGTARFAAADVPFGSVRTFADDAVTIAAPEDALRYFLDLVPSLGVDPRRWGDEQRRRAFTVAASTEEVLTRKIQEVIADAMRAGDTGGGGASVGAVLRAAGVSPDDGAAYSEMVFRTNAQDAFQAAVYEEARHPDVRDEFPVWQYQGIDDDRAGADHRPKFGRYYPAAASFADVRGPRPFNCRCGLSWVDRHTWAELQAQGARVETSW